jgi:hypothetical protein
MKDEAQLELDDIDPEEIEEAQAMLVEDMAREEMAAAGDLGFDSALDAEHQGLVRGSAQTTLPAPGALPVSCGYRCVCATCFSCANPFHAHAGNGSRRGTSISHQGVRHGAASPRRRRCLHFQSSRQGGAHVRSTRLRFHASKSCSHTQGA